jgi:hypothetical protein
MHSSSMRDWVEGWAWDAHGATTHNMSSIFRLIYSMRGMAIMHFLSELCLSSLQAAADFSVWCTGIPFQSYAVLE